MNMAKIVLVGSLLLMSFVIQDGYAHGVISIKDCNVTNLGYNQELYKEDIISINQAASLYVEGHPNYTMRQLADYMNNVYLNQPVELAHCLRDLGINPTSVAQISHLAYGALVYDRVQLQGYSPNFLREIPAPGVDLAQNILSIPHQVPPLQNQITQDRKQPYVVEPNPVQVTGEPVDSVPLTMQKGPQQIPIEYVFLAIVAASAVGVAIIYNKKAKENNRVLFAHQKRF